MAIDFGASLTKIVAGTSASSWMLFGMEPEVAEVNGDAIASLQKIQFDSKPKNSAWIKIKERYFAVGYLAKTKFWANRSLNQPKASKAIYKVLSAVWIVQQKLKLPPSFELDLFCLLPVDEYELILPSLVGIFRQSLASYFTPTEEIKVELTKINFFSEGTGIISQYGIDKPTVFQNQAIAVLMLGYRNASLITFMRGNNIANVTSPYGFGSVIREVLPLVESKTENRYAEIIFKAGFEVKEQILSRLSLYNQEQETSVLKSKVKMAIANYELALENWFSEVLTPDVELVLACGGTVDFFGKELERILSSYKIIFHGNISLPHNIAVNKDANRFLDVWGIWLHLNNVAFPKPKRGRRKKMNL